ncbi:MAG: GNAT family N-acetyltransferase [Sulfuritalea sp.]|nr:GNAT family N-acetyltransferase [Sulfuritalea sp.]
MDFDLPTQRRHKPTLTLRRLAEDDIEAARELQRKVYRRIPPLRAEQFSNLLKVFPQGQFVAIAEGRLVGIAISLVVLWDDYGLGHTYDEVTGEQSFNTHNMQGRTLYGAEVCVDPEARGMGVGHALYQERRRLCRQMNLKRIIAGGRLPGYRANANHMSAQEYAQRVIWGDLDDPVLDFQMGEGFHFCGILSGYLPADIDSVGNAALIVWLNPHYDPAKPTRLPRLRRTP